MGITYCLDTYALIEITQANPKFAFLFKEEFVIPSTTLAEFYGVILRNKGKDEAELWMNKLSGAATGIPLSTMISAQNFRFSNKQKNISFFDGVGYCYAEENNLLFVTGDREFKNLKGVKFITK